MRGKRRPAHRDDPTVAALIDALIAAIEARNRKLALWWRLTCGRWTITIPMEDAMITMVIGYKLPMHILPVDAAGNPARVDGVPTWALSDGVYGTLTVDVDGLGATFVPAGILGAVQIRVDADADLGEGVRTLTGLLDVQIEAGEAVSLSITTDPPVPI